MNWLLTRLTEPSTWRGIFALLTAGGITVSPDLQNAILAVGLAAIGLLNVVIKEKSNATPPPPADPLP